MSQELDSGAAVATGGGRYSVLRCLGAGAKAETYLCADSQTGGASVVRKLLSPELSAENPDIVDAVFPRWAALVQPNLVRVLDYGWEEGRAYLNTEFFEGVPILQALSGAPLDKVWRVFGQLLLALDRLYAHNVPHLDLKPQNVLLGADASGAPLLKLVDYGWMALLHPYNPADSNAIGTAPYAAPEYALRRSPDLRADLYSVGILLFSVLARRPPYEGRDAAALLQAQFQRDAPALKSVVAGAPAPLSDFIQHLLNRDPQGRFESPQQALAALQAAVGASFPTDALPWPPAFSDPQQVFRSKEALKLFRRIAIQGGRWAIQGPEGSGKSFFARWLERLLWSNQKRVFRLLGENLSLIQGEVSLNPSVPTYLIVDDADRAAIEAWLAARPYGHVVALGRDMAWAKAEQGWQRVEWKAMSPAETVALCEAAFGKLDARVPQALQARFRGLPGGLAAGAAALERQGVLRREGAVWRLDVEKFSRGAGSPQLGSPWATLPEASRRRLARLAAAPVPWPAAVLREEPELEAWLRAGWLRRRLKGGEEFFQSELGLASAAEGGLSPEDLLAALEEVLRRGWAGEVREALGRFFPAEGAPPAASLLRARAAVARGDHAEALKLLTAPFVNGLDAAAKPLAFETLGLALDATGKAPQAEAAFKNAFQAYKAAGQAAGQARVLLHLGVATRRAGDGGKALGFFQQALAAAAGAPEKDELRGRIELAVAQLYAAATDFEGAESHFQEALGALEAARHGGALAEAYAVYAEHCFKTLDSDRAEIFCHEALGWALFQGDLAAQARICRLWARILMVREDLRGAGARLGEAVAALAKSPDEAAYARALLERAEFAEAARDLESAQRDSRKAFEIARRLKLGELEGETLLVVGKIQSRDLERLDAAVKTLQGARQILEKLPGAKRLWECDFQLGDIARFRGDGPTARAHYQRALQGLDGVMAALPPQGEEAERLRRRRGELEMSIQVLG